MRSYPCVNRWCIYGLGGKYGIMYGDRDRRAGVFGRLIARVSGVHTPWGGLTDTDEGLLDGMPMSGRSVISGVAYFDSARTLMLDLR